MSLREITGIADDYVGSDLESIYREAAIGALHENSDAEEIEMHRFRKAMESIRPTIAEELMRYCENIQDQFKGGSRKGLSPDTHDDGHIGFQ